MRHVRCMFRVLSVAQTYSGELVVKLAPTYSTRKGEQVEENKAFFTATPSGSGEVTICPLSPAAALFRAGEYVYLDLYQGQPQEDRQVPEGGVRSLWTLESVELYPYQFSPKLAARTRPGNEGLFGEKHASGMISMTINNTDAWPFFAFVPDKAKTYSDRPLVTIDFSLA